ncbi:MAG: hypothetical protein AAF492_17460, partial [Verrucomicrobiota bacterium]
ILVGLLFLLSLASGKRAGFAGLVVLPIVIAWVSKQYRYIVLSLIAIGSVVFILCAAQGRIINLPLSVQRTLVHFPGRWSPELSYLKFETFRDSLREIAIEQIERDPLFGKKGYAFSINEAWTKYYMTGNEAMLRILFAAQGSSWHNTWLGIAADFGIPATLFWFAFVAQALYWANWARKRLPPDSYRHTFVSMMQIAFFIDLVLRSWTSGHSALNPYSVWWKYAVVMSIVASLKAEAMAIRALSDEEQESRGMEALSPPAIDPIKDGIRGF